jgi:hypothetical protein
MDMVGELFSRDAPEKEDTVLWTAMVSVYMDAASVGEGHAVLSGNASEELGFWLCKEFTPGGRLEGAQDNGWGRQCSAI